MDEVRVGRVTLVDVGIGAEGSPAWWAPVPGRLVEALDEVGIVVADVDTVVHTCLPGSSPSSPVGRVPVVGVGDLAVLAQSRWPS